VKIHIPNLEFATDVDKLKFLSLIAVLSPIPRAIQYMVSELKQLVKLSEKGAIIDSDLISSLYTNTVTAIDESYPGMLTSALSPALFKALIFQEDSIVDDEVVSAITCSKLTNSIMKFRPYQYARIVPTASIVSMSMIEKSPHYDYPSVIHNVMNEFLQYFTDPKKMAGVSLEVVLNAVVDARLTVLADLARSKRADSEEVFFLRSLLQIMDIEGFNEEVIDALRYRHIVVTSKRLDEAAIPRSNDKLHKNKGKYPM
jgi:hypothetical protein